MTKNVQIALNVDFGGSRHLSETIASALCYQIFFRIGYAKALFKVLSHYINTSNTLNTSSGIAISSSSDVNSIIVKKLNSLKHLVRTTLAESHN